jgi:hypothetical protein
MNNPKTRRQPFINGRRGAFQLVYAPVYLIIGLSFVIAPGGASRSAALRWLIELGLIQFFGALWILAAGAAVAGAFQPRPRDWFSFAALVFAPAVWGCLFVIGVIAGAPPFGLVSAAIYWLFAAGPMIVAGMQGANDRDRRKTRL